MRINKLNLLSIAACCLVSALWSESKCMEQIRNYEPIRHINNYQTELSAGSIVSFAGEVAPHGWLLCDGQQYSNQRYPELYEVVREKYVSGESWVIEANSAYSDPIRGMILIQSGRLFLSNPGDDSDLIRPPIPIQSGR